MKAHSHFSLVRFSCWGNGGNEITVLPKKAQIKSLSFLHYDLSRSYSGNGGQQHALGDEEFRACREYMTGDSIRNIDWAGWARTGKAIVKEYDDRATVRISLVLDSSVSTMKLNKAQLEKRFEFAVSSMSGCSYFLAQHNVLIDKLVVGTKSINIDSEGQARLANEEVQKSLALCQRSDKKFSQVDSTDIAEELSGEKLVLIILFDLSDLKRDMIKALEGQGISVKILCISNGTTSEDIIAVPYDETDLAEELYL